MAGRVLMPLHDNPDSERLVEWMNEVPQYSLNDQKPSDWNPFQGCDYCNGLCSVLESADCVRRLLDGQRVPIFQGRYEELGGIATRGCKFAEYLKNYVNSMEIDYGLDEPIDLAFRRIDKTGPSSVRLVLLEGYRLEAMQPLCLAVATAPNDPADTVTSRLPDTDPTLPRNLMLLKRTLFCCVNHQFRHKLCPDTMPVRTELPTRVVYVGTDNEHDPPRLHLGNGEIAGYVALSYCWGGFQRHQTERNRIERYMLALPVQQLPKSLQDAIFLTRALGIQYVWIDSLCIIQDCDEDKDREMARMAYIFKNAIFTISAARAKSCDEGFLGVQDARISLLQKSIKLPINCLNGAIGSALLYPTRTQFGRHNTPIDKRAWTYQEQVLSRRLVSFFDNAIEWSCQSCHVSDDRLETDEMGVTHSPYRNILAPLSGRSDDVSKILNLTSGLRYTNLRNLEALPLSTWWWRAVYEYTMGSLSNLDDRLPAIAGVASEFQNLNGDVYVAGLWMKSLIRDLQWFVCRISGEQTDNNSNKDVKYDAPTWTWASVHECKILGHSEKHENSQKYRLDSDTVEIIDCKVNLVSPLAPFGSVNGGELKIRAPLKFLSDRGVREMLKLRHLRQLSDRERLENWGVEEKSARFIGTIFLDNRSQHYADELTTLCAGTAPHIESTGVWFLGLSKHADLDYESCGLALEKREDGLFGRIGLFQIYVGDKWVKYGMAEQIELRASWGNDYVVTTVTIF